MQQLAGLILFLVAPFAVMLAWSRRARRHARDPDIDRLIALNAAKPRGGMEAVDWEKANRASARVWHTTLRAQRRWGTVVAPAEKGREGRVN